MNISIGVSPAEEVSKLLSLIGQPARIQILFALADQPACVCHLEALLHLRQASISQHLMTLRKSGLVCTQRDGRHIFYQLSQPGVLQVLQQAAGLTGLDPGTLQALSARPVPGCACPHCNPASNGLLRAC